MALSNEEELFTEASEDLRNEFEDALASARESLPPHEVLVIKGETALHEVVASLSADLDSSESAEDLRTAQKRFAVGERADAVDEEFGAEVQTALDEVHEAVEALQTVGHTAPELGAALTTVHEVHPESQTDQTDAGRPGEPDPTDPPVDSNEDATRDADDHSGEDSAQQTVNNDIDMTDDEIDSDEARAEDEDSDDGDNGTEE